MGLIGVFQIFESRYHDDGGPADATLFYATNSLTRPSSSSIWERRADGLDSVCGGAGVTLLQLWLSKKWVHYQGE